MNIKNLLDNVDMKKLAGYGALAIAAVLAVVEKSDEQKKESTIRELERRVTELEDK